MVKGFIQSSLDIIDSPKLNVNSSKIFMGHETRDDDKHNYLIIKDMKTISKSQEQATLQVQKVNNFPPVT